MEGQLSKFTNLVKGWQFRWFMLDAESGSLAYYLVSVCLNIEEEMCIWKVIVLKG